MNYEIPHLAKVALDLIRRSTIQVSDEDLALAVAVRSLLKAIVTGDAIVVPKPPVKEDSNDNHQD